MKKLILLFMPMLFISFNLMCQDMYVSPDTVFERQSISWNFTGVIKVDSTISKEALFQKSRQWFSESFVSAKGVIDNEDKAEGVIYGKGRIKMAKDVDGDVKFTVEIRCKNGKIKYTLSNFYHEGACIINAYGTCATGVLHDINLGPLTQSEITYSYAVTGRKKEKFWNSIRSQTKKTTYNIIVSLNESLKKEVINDKDSW